MLGRQLLPTPLRASSSVLSLRVDWNYGFQQLRNIRRNPPRLVFDEHLAADRVGRVHPRNRYKRTLFMGEVLGAVVLGPAKTAVLPVLAWPWAHPFGR